MALWTIWYASLLLAATAVAVMLLLVLRRIVQERLARRREALRAATSAALLRHLDGSAGAADVLRAAAGRADLVVDLVFQMRELVRGQDAERLVAAARAVGGFERALARLRKRNPPVRADAVRRLAMFGPDAIPLLRARLRDPSMGVRIAAAIELTGMGAPPSLEALGDAMQVGDAAYSEDLRRIFRPAVAADPDRAIGMLEDDWTPEAMRPMLLDGLAQAGALRALPVVGAQAQTGSPAVRAEALRALAALGHPGGAPIVVEAMDDPHWWVRAQAANAARRIGLADAVEPLRRLLDDEQWWVRFRAAEALCDLGEPGRRALATAAANEDRAGEVSQLVLAEKGLS